METKTNSAAVKGVAVAAGMRGASWDPARMLAPYSMTPHPLATEDGQRTLGFLYARGGEKTVVCQMHPRELAVTHYLVPDVLDAGCAMWVQGPRSVGNDLRLEHEIALYDVAAGVRFLRDQGFDKIILLGNSGGAGLYALYNQQSLAAPEKRITHTPGGRPTKLAGADLPAVDGIVLVSPHPGQGTLLMNSIDPSVTDEEDPFSVDAALNPFDAANGFRRAPESAQYTPAFAERYRAAQRARVARLDARALESIAERQAARDKLKTVRDRGAKIIASHQPIFEIWRTDADLRAWDTSLDPSDRLLGSLWGGDPFVSNYGSVGFARIVTPESWLSTWSGLSSNASFERCGSSIEQPCLMVEYTGDNCAFPGDLDVIYDGMPATDKQRIKVRGNHHGLPLQQGDESGQLIAGRTLQRWLRERFPTR